MSPILTRPVREQLEHDRVIRQLQARYKRKNDVIINPGNEQNQSITVGELVVFPDLLLFGEGGRRLVGTVEVETGESVNSIEARAEWGVYSKLKVPLHLYVPPSTVDAAKRICAEYQIVVAELWTYTTSFDQVRFNMVHRSPEVPMARIAVKMAKPAAAPEAIVPKAIAPEQNRGATASTPKPAAPKATAPTLRPFDRSTGSRSPRAESRGDKLKVAPSRVEGRQAQNRPELSAGSRSPRAQSRGEQSRATRKAASAKVKPKAKAKPATRKAKPSPKAKPKKGAKKRR